MTRKHPTTAELKAGMTDVAQSPQDNGVLEMIVCRPEEGRRLIMDRAELQPVEGLVGDNWKARGSRQTEDGRAHPGMQIAIVNSRLIQLLAGDRSRWPLAGDQLFVDLNLSPENLPAGQRLIIGRAVLEITDVPHTGCSKFTERYGRDAIRFVNSDEGRAARRRGVYARVVTPGLIRSGDAVIKKD